MAVLQVLQKLKNKLFTDAQQESQISKTQPSKNKFASSNDEKQSKNENIYDLLFHLSLNLGETVIVESKICIIQNVEYTDTITQKPNYEDIITVKFQNEVIKKYDRYQLRPTQISVQNRRKLNKYCTIEVYSSSKQWEPRYIENKRAKWITMNGIQYNVWSHKIRCCAPLLNLIQTSVIFIFAHDINHWCYGKIMDIKKSPHYGASALDIFKVHYVKEDNIYIKYVHQFTGSIALIGNKVYTDCSVFDEDNKATKIFLDPTDLKYYRLLLQGHYRRAALKSINNDVLSLLVKYVDFSYNYGLVMAIEQRTFSGAIKNKNNKLMPKCFPPTEISSLPPLHPLEIKVRNKLIKRDKYTSETFREARKKIHEKLMKDTINERMSNY